MKRTSVSCKDVKKLIRFAHNYMRVHNDRRTLAEVLIEVEKDREESTAKQIGETGEIERDYKDKDATTT